MKAAEVRKIADDGIDGMVRRVQTALGIDHGDVAAQFFSDNKLRDQITVSLMDYIITELSMQMEEIQRNDN